MKFGVIVFPGSNCDHDCYYVLKKLLNQDVQFIWHKQGSLDGCEAVVLPGGFSYGDYLRTGAIARFSPVMREVVRFAQKGGLVLGICNGFQILLEAGLLPGAMLRNKTLRFVCKYVHVKVENNNTAFTNQYQKGEVLKIPIAHNEGNYFAPEDLIKRLEDNQQIVFRYCDSQGLVTEEANPNGSMGNIAGIINERGNVLGMMPHPERASEELLGSSGGRRLFLSMIA